MHQYALFSGQTYYPSYAWFDMRGHFPTVAECRALLPACKAYGFDWYQIVDLNDGTIVEMASLHNPDELYLGKDHFLDNTEDEQSWQRFLVRYRGTHGYTP